MRPRGFRVAEGLSARGSGGFGWSGGGRHTAALRWAAGALAAGRMGYSGEDPPELGALLANTTFPLPALQSGRKARLGSTPEPPPRLHSHGASPKP